MSTELCRPNLNLHVKDFDAIRNILNSKWVSNRDHVAALEEVFITRFKVQFAIACSSATTGLMAAVKAAWPPGVTIELPAFTWPSTLLAAQFNQGKIIFQDIRQDTWLMQAGTLPKNRFRIVVDIFGNQYSAAKPSDKSRTIYDAAHGFDLPKLGHRGIVEVVSLSATKPVTATEGGMILTNEADIAAKARQIVRYIGRMEEINAYLAKRSIENFDSVGYQQKMEAIREKYIADLDFEYELQTIPEASNRSSFQFLVKNQFIRNRIFAALAEKDIVARAYYEPLAAHLENTNEVFNRIISLPFHPFMADRQDEIIDLANRAAMASNEITGVTVVENLNTVVHTKQEAEELTMQ
ncbi:MAG: DegT/DnrJ/EryC1/StrS aminotransferase family protein [Deferribacteres bacterium]|nr:DegT/DnrJ/EryC1/StrS aminotransferase family protein [candidate division KSB1 bacterium]MCB9501972.1 DegT/DnrJ/EryC1/StrS aminotransferase family protein [Deferribacteres bacterium]